MNWGSSYILFNHRGRRVLSQRAQRLCVTLRFFSVNSVVKKILCTIFISLGLLHAKGLDECNHLLKSGNDTMAIACYDYLVRDGFIGHELFFNLGTAYQKQGNIPFAIVNFEKALRMKPGDRATQQQLIQLNLKLQDKPVIYDDSGLLAFLNKIQFALGIDAWAFLSIFLMMLVPLVIFISYKFKTLRSKKLIFMSSVLWFLLSGFSVLMARNNYHYKYLRTEGVVTDESLVVYDASNSSSKIKFNIHQGTKVEIVDSTQTMYRINYSGEQGWILRKGIQKIEL
jgi:hypothetical protein